MVDYYQQTNPSIRSILFAKKWGMNYVEPIRSQKKIAQIKNLLRGQERYRDLLLFVFGINSALRISDLLGLQVGHVLDENKNIRSRFSIKEKKRGKRQEIVINSSLNGSV